jgi:2-polyprenyl-3-methyl-5-hydroxy-6-metoxy-1,4-benzoquinol methylase
MTKHWTEKLFIDESELFEVIIKDRFRKTDREIDALFTLFKKYNVPEGGLILDLACGIGRISIPLAQKGFNVIGVDLSKSYIDRAKEYSEIEGVSDKIKFIEGDIREVESILEEYSERFDVVLNMWTSMGYWDEETDTHILTQSLNLTKPNGIFIMHTANRDYLIRNFQARDYDLRRDGFVILMERNLDLETSRMINYWTYYKKEEEDLRFLNRIEINHRVYSLHELKKQFQDANWSYTASYGGFELQPLTYDHFSMIIVAKKVS